MKLKELLIELPVEVVGYREVEITGITADSRTAFPGALFVVKKGQSYDGRQFIPQALAAGVVAIAASSYDPLFRDIVQILHPDIAFLEKELATRFYDNPAEKLFLVGVTGTNGKTTTSYLIRHLLNQCGLVGTVEWITGKRVLAPTLTTPDLVTLMKLFHEMVLEGCSSAVMEVSSHALDQGRARGIPFDLALFTNLTLDHLDYHQTMERYAAAKAQLFTTLSPTSYALFNRDDPWSSFLLKECFAKRFSYGFNREADFYARDLQMTLQGMTFTVEHQGRCLALQSPLVGRFNAYNILAALGVGHLFGLSWEKIAQRLNEFQGVPGRLERVINRKGLHVFVDYAHTDDALKNVLQTLREFKRGQLITVFGCGGNRDASKRPKMVAVAEQLSDFFIVTTDNPRQEDPQEIIRQILTGCRDFNRCLVEVDRRTAIAQALARATPQDIVLIAGKGHEKTQVFAHYTLPFDDRDVVQQLLN